MPTQASTVLSEPVNGNVRASVVVVAALLFTRLAGVPIRTTVVSGAVMGDTP